MMAKILNKRYFYGLISLLVTSMTLLVSCEEMGVEDNQKDTLLEGISVLVDHVELARDSSVEVSFKVQPANSAFNYDTSSESCQISLFVGEEKIPSNFLLQEVLPKQGVNGEIIPGEYVAVIIEKDSSVNYYQENSFFVIHIGGDKRVYSNSFLVESAANGTQLINVGIHDDAGSYRPFFCYERNQYVFCVPRTVDNSVLLDFRHNGQALLSEGSECVSGKTTININDTTRLCVRSRNGEVADYTITVFPCDLPAISIITQTHEPILSKEVWTEKARMAVWNIDGSVEDSLELKIRCRGNASMRFPKKSYAIKLSKKNELLGMPSDKRWDFLSNWRDRTKMRNYIAFNLARKCDGLAWTPRMEYCELFLDGKHLGLYALTEHIKISENRINIPKLKNTDTSEDAITGGYLMEIDSYYDNDAKFRSSVKDYPYMIKEPEDEDLLTIHFNYIQNYINTFEEALYSQDFTEKYHQYIDTKSFIDWWIVQELTGNDESKRPHSCYVYKDRGGKLFAGPVWDFDWPSFIPNTTVWRNKWSLYYERLFEDPAFVSEVKNRWRELKPCFENIRDIVIEEEARKISFSEQRDSMYWPILDEIAELFNGDEHLSFNDAVERMKTALDQRIQWIDNAIENLQ